MRKIEMTIMLLLMGFFFLGVKAQPAKSDVKNIKNEADLFWAKKPTVLSSIRPLRLSDNYSQEQFLKHEESIIRANIYDELYRRLLREWGIEFWIRFPNDKRRFGWLRETLCYEPAYFSNLKNGAIAKMKRQSIVSLDTTARNAWKILLDKYLRESMNGNEFLLAYGFYLQLSSNANKWRDSENEKFDYKEHLNKVVTYIKYQKRRMETLQQSSIDKLLIIRERKDFGLDEQDINSYVDLLKATGLPELQKVSLYMENLLKLEQLPLELNAKSINGEQITLKQFRGKLVLVDFWHPTCPDCIALMPDMKAVYDKFKAKGFEVLSASLFYQRKDELARIKKIYEKIGADWPLITLGGNKGEPGRLLFELYGWNGVPQLLLLDEEGKLIHFNGELRYKGGLEKLVKQYFENKSIENRGSK